MSAEREVRLQRLQLRNFKGIKDFELAPHGADTLVFGDNATGKTTLLDAWKWLLFGRDSANRAEFEIKTLRPDGQAVSGLEHAVAGWLDVDGEELHLQRTYKEQWTKKRGQTERQFTGHTTEYRIGDGPAVKMKDYQAQVAELVDEQTFLLLTDVRHFSEHLHWRERRRLLLEVAGDVTDADVIATDPALAELPKILGKETVEQRRKALRERRRLINESLEKLPTRIDEVQRGIAAEDVDTEALSAEVNTLAGERRELAERQVRLEHGGEAADLRRRIAEKQAQLQELQSARRAEAAQQAGAAGEELRRQAREAGEQAEELEAQLRRYERQRASFEADWQAVGEKLEELRREYASTHRHPMPDFNIADRCPTCNQPLPEDEVEAARDEAMAEWREQRAKRLRDIDAEGQRQRARLEQLEKERPHLDVEATEQKRDELHAKARELREQAEQAEHTGRSSAGEPSDKERVLAEEIAELQRQVEGARRDHREELVQLAQRMKNLDEQLAEKRKALAGAGARERAQTRIAELEAEGQALGQEFDEAEHGLALCELFLTRKTQLLDEKINAFFNLARFRLFNRQVDGGIEETCEVTYQGVPYADLNNGARINIGLDVIATLQRHYRLRVPVWIDNAESVTELLPIEAQTIKLVVSAAYRTLTQKPAEEEAA